MKIYLASRYSVLFGLVLSSFLSFANTPINTDADKYFQQGRLLYDSKNYESALSALLKAVELAPMRSTYHHILGKCYGRIAEEGNWLTALRYVRKTLAQFKQAVELDDKNIQAWIDLEEFYRRAPGFLGGDKDKAREIRAKLADPGSDHSAKKPDLAVPKLP